MKKLLPVLALLLALLMTGCSAVSSFPTAKTDFITPGRTSGSTASVPETAAPTAQTTAVPEKSAQPETTQAPVQATPDADVTAGPEKTPGQSSGEKDDNIESPTPSPTPDPLSLLTKNTLVCCEGRLLVRIPENWKDQFLAQDYGDSVSFYDAYNHDHENGGFLFSLILSDFTSEDEIQLPHFEVIGKWSGDRLLIADFPSDVQFDPSDDRAATVYQDMYGQFDQIRQDLVLLESPLDTLLFCDGRAGMQYPDAWKEHVVLKYRSDSFGVYSYLNSVQRFGGHIFTLLFIDEKEDYTVFPSYDLLWIADGKAAVVLYPTDVQFNYEDEDCTAEYMALYDEAEDTAKTIVRH